MTNDPTNMATAERDGGWRNLALAELALAGVLACAALLFAYFGWTNSGERGVWAAMAALGVCWLPNAMSLVAMSVVRDPQQSMPVMLLGMILRMGFPFVVVIGLEKANHWLVEAHAVPMIVAMYLLALTVETLLTLWIVGGFRGPAVKAS